MKPFLLKTAEYIYNEYNSKFPRICVVLPNKRGALFLKNYLIELAGKTTWIPTIISIEELIEDLSGLVCPDNITLTIELYNCWTNLENHKNETFDEFLKWSGTVLRDFDEIDRNLVDAKAIFSNLTNIREIENWSLSLEPLTEFQQRYLNFMKSLGDLYNVFSSQMLSKGTAWRGLLYRKAVENVFKNDFTSPFEKFLICGFNALNVAEGKIFSQLKLIGKAEILWDIDTYYFNDMRQEAGYFLRQNFKNSQLKSKHFIENNLETTNKTIEIKGVPRNVGQAAAASSQIKKWINENIDTKNMAVVMGDESLLFPMLSMIPNQVPALNITLEYPLNKTSVYDMYEQILQLQVQAEHNNKKAISFYFKDLYRLFFNPCFNIIYEGKGEFSPSSLVDKIKNYNLTFVSFPWMKKIGGESFEKLNFIFERWENGLIALQALDSVNELFKFYYNSIKNKTTHQKIELEFVLAFSQALNRLKDLLEQNPAINNLNCVYQLLKQVVSEKSVPFFGQPLAGLQLMGVLETRTLDFENVIILGLNEDILPKGRSGNSFIPYDLKRYFGLPLHSEKDAIYAYHFYRLLQRAKNVCLIFNTESDTLGCGEKSRFLTQLEMEMSIKNPNAKISTTILTGTLSVPGKNEITIPKNKIILNRLENKCTGEKQTGLSPSSINTFSECALKFYFKYIAKMLEKKDVEEDMEAGTFGSILHKTLENLYKPFIGKSLLKENLNFTIEKIASEIKIAYISVYQEVDFLKGKNLLAVNVIELFVQKMLKEDKKLINQLALTNQELKLIDLEKLLTSQLLIQTNNKPMSVKISGKVDRLDWVGEYLRIVDYKTSVNSDKDNFIFKIESLKNEELFFGNGNSKMLQLFIYAWLVWKNNLCLPHLIVPCIIPFKNYSGQPNRILDSKKNPILFTEVLLQEFELSLILFVEKIFNNNIPFNQTEDIKKCEYCGYKVICNK